MLGLKVVGKHLPKVADFYFGKSVLVTGAGGYIGSLLLENLLRNCPGIKSIFILLRSKKDVHFEDRKDEIFNKKIFEKLKEENREFLDKVHVVAGDVSLSNLGMSAEDTQLLTEEVSIVFHCAATINFSKPLKYALINNVLGLNSIIELGRRMRKLKALVYTSTAYSNCNHTNVILEEEVYRLPVRAEKFLDALKNEDDEKLQELFYLCKPDWPNTYTFSKCLAENVIMDTASDLPIAIIRPSMVFSTWKHPIPGYDEGNSSVTAYIIAAGKGFIKVSYADPTSKLDLVPADIVANTLVLASCSVGTKRCATPMIVHCTATKKLQVTTSEYAKTSTQLALKFPFPQAFLKPTNCIIVPFRYPYYILAAYHHYLPAIVIDGMLKILGKKPRVYSSYRIIDKGMNILIYFLFHSFEFERKNLDYLDKLIHPEDKKDMSLDFKDATFQELSSKIPEVSLFYDWKMDNKSPSERQKIIYWRHMLVYGIQGMFIISSIFSIYCFTGYVL